VIKVGSALLGVKNTSLVVHPWGTTVDSNTGWSSLDRGLESFDGLWFVLNVLNVLNLSLRFGPVASSCLGSIWVS